MKVNITAKETVRYDVTVDMTKEEFDLLNNHPGGDITDWNDPDCYEILRKYLRAADGTSDGFEYSDVEKVKENGER